MKRDLIENLGRVGGALGCLGEGGGVGKRLSHVFVCVLLVLGWGEAKGKTFGVMHRAGACGCVRARKRVCEA